MSDQEPFSGWAVLFIPLIFAIVFPIFWCSVIWLVSQISGWSRLAQRYRTQQAPTGKMWSWQYGLINWAGYNGVLNLTANAEGLFMETLWLFSFGHPRLFIPWHDFHEVKAETWFFSRQVKAKIGIPSMATVRLPATVFEQSEGRKILPTYQ